MCHGENSAEHCMHYLNAQLGQLHANAVDCGKKRGNREVPGDEHKYSVALAEFFIGKHRNHPSKEDTHFHGFFDKPRLGFICNHQVVLYLHLKKGFFNVDYMNSGPVRHDKHQHFENFEVAFRVPFKVHGVPSPSATGPGDHMLQVMVFDYDAAQMVLYPPALDAHVCQALSHYLHEYLLFLRSAGHHVLFSLPDFDDDERHLILDYSQISSAHLLQELEGSVHGIPLKKINDNLSFLWLKAARLAGARDGYPSDRLSVCLAEFQSTWVDEDFGAHFHVKFGAPRVTTICPEEVLFTIAIDEVNFYDSDDFSREPRETYKHWEIAMMVNIVIEKDTHGHGHRYKLDFNTARFCHHLSVVPVDHEEVAMRYCEIMLQFLTTEYLDYMEIVHVHIIYEIDIRFPDKPIVPSGPKYPAGSPDRPCYLPPPYTCDPKDPHGPLIGPGGIKWDVDVFQGEIVVCGDDESPTCGFETVMVVTQNSILAHFEALWKMALASTHTHCLVQWSHDGYFDAKFGAFTMRLLSNDKVMVWINIEEGSFKQLENWELSHGGETHNFANWRLAFEVSLKISDHSAMAEHMSDTCIETFNNSHLFKEHSGHEHRTIRHIFLDFATAEFVHEHSSFGDLKHICNRSSIGKVDAVVHYVQEFYLKEFSRHGHHILHSVPVWTGGEVSNYSLTAVSFQVYTRHIYNRYNCTLYDIAHPESPMIAIMGMYHFHPLPSVRLKWSSTLVVHKKEVQGHVVFSRAAFLERTLALLGLVSANTTVVPSFAGVEDGQWKLVLTTWAKHEHKKSRPCEWKVISRGENGMMEFEWIHRDEWTYRHEGGAHDLSNGAFHVLCHTRNHLRIPVGAKRHNGMEVTFSGHSTLELGFEGTANTWSSKASANWETTLRVRWEGHGLKVNIASSNKPVFTTDKSVGQCAVEARPRLESQFAAEGIDFSAVITELRTTLEGIWKYSFPVTGAYVLANPSFDRFGDFAVEFRTFVAHTHREESISISPVTPLGGQERLGHGHVTGGYARPTSASLGHARDGSPKIARPAARHKASLYKRAKSFVKEVLHGDDANGNGHVNGHSLSKRASEGSFGATSPLHTPSGTNGLYNQNGYGIKEEMHIEHIHEHGEENGEYQTTQSGFL